MREYYKDEGVEFNTGFTDLTALMELPATVVAAILTSYVYFSLNAKITKIEKATGGKYDNEYTLVY